MTTRSQRDRGGAGRFRGLLVGVALVAIAGGGFAVGWYFSHVGFIPDEQSPRELRRALEAAQRRADNAGKELAALRTRSEVDRQSLELVRREMVAQKQYVTELEEDLRFYRSLMSPDSAPGQVQVREPEISTAATEGHYTFRIVIHQEAVKHQLIHGELVAGLEGELDGKAATHIFAGKSAPGAGDWPAVKFRYFQEFTGSFELPEGFEPTKVFVKVKVNKPRKLDVREEFTWQGEEYSGDVGK